MIQFLGPFFIFFTTSVSWSQTNNYKVISLYEQNALLTERFLPFDIRQSSDNMPVELIGAYADKPCYAMVDPYRANIALFFCTEPTEAASFFVKIRQNGSPYNFKTPEFKIRKLALLSSTPDPYKPPLPDSPGETLYKNNCKSCHNASNPMVQSTTITHLKDLFAGTVTGKDGKKITTMTKFNGLFSDSQLTDLVNYINEEL